MGAVNYFTSDYITMGLRPYDRYDLENDYDFMEELQAEVDEYGGTLESALDSYINDSYECDYENNGNKTLYFCLIWRCRNVRYYLFNIVSFCSVR